MECTLAVNLQDGGDFLFTESFEALTGHASLHWHRRLFERFLAREIPALCNLPTELGKNSVIPIWAAAVATRARAGEITLPRRLVYIVTRRTVVDQAATSVVETIR
jgi:CRISPR-associated endonuclease/helicase Cas3